MMLKLFLALLQSVRFVPVGERLVLPLHRGLHRLGELPAIHHNAIHIINKVSEEWLYENALVVMVMIMMVVVVVVVCKQEIINTVQKV